MAPQNDFQYLVTVCSIAAIITIVSSIGNLSDGFSARNLVAVADRQLPQNPYSKPQSHAREFRLAEADMRFQQAVMMLHAKRYDMAIKSLHRVLELAPLLPEAHSNMGYALLGTGEYKIAYDFFSTAVELRSMFDSAYYGMALALAGLGEYEGAIGAMRTYLHLTSNLNYQDKAEAYVADWRSMLDKQ